MSKLDDKIAESTTGARGGIPRRKDRIKPKHRLVLQKLQEGMALSPAMIASGYTPATARQTDKLQASKSWQMLMDEQIPESLLTMRHRELLDKRVTEVRVVGRGRNQRIEVVDLGVDVQAVKAGLEMGYKIRGKYLDEVRQSDKPTQVYNLFYQPNVQASIRAFESNLKDAITHGGIATIVDAPTTDAPADGGGSDAGDRTPDAGGGDTDGREGESAGSPEGEQGAQ